MSIVIDPQGVPPTVTHLICSRECHNPSPSPVLGLHRPLNVSPGLWKQSEITSMSPNWLLLEGFRHLVWLPIWRQPDARPCGKSQTRTHWTQLKNNQVHGHPQFEKPFYRVLESDKQTPWLTGVSHHWTGAPHSCTVCVLSLLLGFLRLLMLLKKHLLHPLMCMLLPNPKITIALWEYLMC